MGFIRIMLKKSKSKVVFISPEESVYCFGLRTLSSLVKKCGYESVMVFMSTVYKYYSKKELKQLIDLCKGSFAICITSSAIGFRKAVQITDSLKHLNIPLIMGGVHATLNPEECLRHVDFVCVGEGDHAFVELLESIRKGGKGLKIKNICYKKEGRTVTNDVRDLVVNINKLPFPDYDPVNKFVLFNKNLIPFKEEHFSFGSHNLSNIFFLSFKAIILYHTTRGCPYDCKYCCNKDLKKVYDNKGVYVRFLSPKNIVQGLKYLSKNYPNLEFIWFTDDDFFLRGKKDLNELCDLYKKEVGKPFMCYLNPSSSDEEKLKMLISAGLKRVEVGIQTGSDDINKGLYSRSIALKDVLSAAFLLNKYKDYMYLTEYQVINTSPLEDESSVLKTISFIRSLPKPFFLKVYNLVLFPGSSFEKECGMKKEQVENVSDVNYLDHIQHFKRKKIGHKYVSIVLSMMEGCCKGGRYGSVSERYLDLLLSKKIIWLNNKLPALKYLILYTHLNSNKIYWALPHPALKRAYLSRLIQRHKSFR